MQKANYSALIVSLFLDNPDCYNSGVLVLFKRLRANLPSQEFQAVVQSAKNHLRNVDHDIEHEFFLLLLENDITECLRGTRRLDPRIAADYLERVGIKDYPKRVGEEPDHSQVFCEWFYALPSSTQQQVWDAVGVFPYG